MANKEFTRWQKEHPNSMPCKNTYKDMTDKQLWYRLRHGIKGTVMLEGKLINTKTGRVDKRGGMVFNELWKRKHPKRAKR
jgi:hypothetical protein